MSAYAPCLSLWERWQPKADGEGCIDFSLSVTAKGGASSPEGGAKFLKKTIIHNISSRSCPMAFFSIREICTWLTFITLATRSWVRP